MTKKERANDHTLNWILATSRQLLERYDLIARTGNTNALIYAAGAYALASELAAAATSKYGLQSNPHQKDN